MHKLLDRQLRRSFGSCDILPQGVIEFARMVDEAYAAFDEERAINERSMVIASRELYDQNAELRRKNQQLQEAEILDRERRHLQATVEAMERVLALVGHELRTPVAGIRALAECLLVPGSEATIDWRQFVGNIHQQTVSLSDTLNSLLEVAVLSSGRANWKWSRFSVADAVTQAVRVVTPLVDEHRIHIRADVESPALTMLGDKGAIDRLITNLLGNSIKHTTGGTITAGAYAGDEHGAAWVSIVVQDTGAGIPAELLSKLGQPFQLNSGFTGNSHVQGAGLGLAICREIAAAHGGTLSVSSHVGEGSVFTAHLRADLDAPAQRGDDRMKIEVTPITLASVAA